MKFENINPNELAAHNSKFEADPNAPCKFDEIIEDEELEQRDIEITEWFKSSLFFKAITFDKVKKVKHRG